MNGSKLIMLTLNTEKNKYIIFGTQPQIEKNKNDLNPSVGNKIERVSSIKYLEVIVDEHLSFTEHKLGILCRAREYLDQKTSIL